jgi:hypothetical protein
VSPTIVANVCRERRTPAPGPGRWTPSGHPPCHATARDNDLQRVKALCALCLRGASQSSLTFVTTLCPQNPIRLAAPLPLLSNQTAFPHRDRLAPKKAQKPFCNRQRRIQQTPPLRLCRTPASAPHPSGDTCPSSCQSQSRALCTPSPEAAPSFQENGHRC